MQQVFEHGNGVELWRTPREQYFYYIGKLDGFRQVTNSICELSKDYGKKFLLRYDLSESEKFERAEICDMSKCPDGFEKQIKNVGRKKR